MKYVSMVFTVAGVAFIFPTISIFFIHRSISWPSATLSEIVFMEENSNSTELGQNALEQNSDQKLASRVSAIEEKHKQKRVVQSLVVSAIVLSAMLGAITFLYPASQAKERYMVISGPFTTSLVASGKVVSKNSAMLSFETGGTVDKVNVKEGDKVKEGDVLISLISQDTETEKSRAEAGLLKAKADLRSIQSGATNAQLAVKEAIVKTSEASLDSVYENVVDTVSTTNTVLERELESSLSALLTKQNGDVYRFSFISCDQVKQSDLESRRVALDPLLANFSKITATLTHSSSKIEVDKAFSQSASVSRTVKAYVGDLQDFLNLACNSQVPNMSMYQAAVLGSYTNIAALTSTIQQTSSQLVLQKNVVLQAEKDYELTKSGAKSEDKESLYAVVKQAEAALQGVKDLLQKTKLTAPFDGTVSSLSIHKGESAKPGVPILEVLSNGGFDVEGYVREVDIPYLTIGSDVKITLDAYPAPTYWTGMLSRIDPSPVEQGGVPLYKIKVSFKDEDYRIKDGMSAKIGIILYQSQNTISVPARFIRVTQDGRAYVKKVLSSDGDVYEFEVSPGHRGDDGSLEVVSGLMSGEILDLMDLSKRSAQSGSASAPVNASGNAYGK